MAKMKYAETFLYRLAKKWPTPKGVSNIENFKDLDFEDYQTWYALNKQYMKKIKQGIDFDFYNKEILEIGTGHGGISTLLGIIGAKKVVGIDLNDKNLESAKLFLEKQRIRLKLSKKLPVEFLKMNAYEMEFDEASFDIILADNVFEHFMEPQKVMQQSYTILRRGGKLIVPVFSSIYSKNALHLKNGLKVPWANIFFSERTIVGALYRLAKDDPKLFEAYPGLKSKPSRVRDVRAYKDLNDITYRTFREMAEKTGFTVKLFKVLYPNSLRLPAFIIRKTPFLRDGILGDVFSTGAMAILEKQ